MSSPAGPTSPVPIPRSSSSDLLPASPGLAPPPPLPSTASSLDKSWSPLRIQKPQQQQSPPCQDAGVPSPTKAHHLDGAAAPSSLLANRPSTQTQESEQQPRRTSSSYKHMKTNSLVSNSPFKTVGLPVQPSPSSVGRPPTKHAIDLGLGVSSSSPAISAPPPPRGELQRKQQQRRSTSADGVDDTSSDEDANDRRLRQQQHPDHAVAVQRRLDFQRESKRRQSAGLAGLSSRAKVSASPFLVKSPSFEEGDELARAAGAGGAGGGPLRPPPVGVVGTSSADEDDGESDDEGHGVNHGYLPLPLEPGSSSMMHHPMVDDSPAFSSPGFSSPPTDHDTTASPLASPPSQQPEEASYEHYEQYVQQQEHQEERRFPSAPSTPSRASHLSATADGFPSPSPKSSLKKKRTRRSAGQDGVPLARRERRKTVTFDERPEVSFFDRETSTQAISDEDVAVYGGGGHWDDYDEEEEMSENEMGGQRLDVPYHHHQLHSHDSNDSFEFEREEIPGSPTPRADESFGEVSMLSNEDDDQYDPNELYSATDSFVTSLLEEHLLSPGSVYSPVFPSEGGESPSLQQQEHQFLRDTSLSSPPPSANALSASRDTEDTPTHQPYHPQQQQQQQQQQQRPKIEQPDLPHLAASPADPILLNGNALEPSTHLSPLAVAHHHQGFSPRRSSSTSSLAFHHHPEVHAHQSGPLPDPFLQVSTVQHHLAAEHEQEEEKEEEARNRDNEDGVPYGRSHHADRFRAVQELQKGTLSRHKHEHEKPRSPSPEREKEARADADGFKGQEMEDKDENENEDEGERRHESQPAPSFDALKLEDGAGEEEDKEEGQTKEQADVFGERREISSVNLPPGPPSTEPIPAVSTTTSSSSSSSHLDAPWHLPSFDSSTSPLFGSVSNFASSGDAATARAAKAAPIDEFGSLASFKPSSSAERLRAEETGGTIDLVGSLGSNASGGSSAGRSPRLTRDSIRRRMDAKRAEEDAAALKKRRRDETGGSAAATATVSASPSLHGLDGLGIGFSGQGSRGHVAVYDGPSASYDEPVTTPAAAAAPASSPARPTQSSRSSSYEDRSNSAAQQKRPALAPRASTLSAHDVLHGESALDRLVAPKSRSASPNSGASSPGRSDTGTLRHGSEKEVVVDRLSDSGINLPSSSPIETAFPAHFLLPTTAEDQARREQEKAQRERELMPPPPLPHKVSASSTSARSSRVPSPTLSTSSEHIEEGVTQTREEAIIARKREKRAQEQVASGLPLSRRGRGRRSLSTGDASIPGSATGSANKRRTIAADEHSLSDFGLGGGSSTQEAAAFGDDVSSELDRIAEDKKRGYRLVERPQVYVASDERVAYNARAGDLDRGKAWRSVKRPSDMNEYAEEIRELRSREKLGRAHSKVFVRIVGITDVAVPLPSESQTTFRIVLNNGLHSVETSSYALGQTVQIGQEFELLGLDNLEFSLAVKVKKDIHIQNRLRRLAPVVPARVSTPEPPRPSTPTASVKAQSRLSKLLSSPRKPKPVAVPSPPPAPVVRRVEPAEPPRDDLVRYLAPDGTLAVVKVVFKDISAKCNGQILNLGLPLTGRWSEEGALNAPANANGRRPKTIGRMELQLIQIPSIPGLANDQLPQSLDDTIQGLRHVRWHKMDYFTGTLTQLGGDCTTWRRRQMRIVGGTLEATSDVTKKITARIDLSKMVKILNDGDQPMSVERSFTLVFDNGEDIQFFADSEQEKSDWLHHLHELLGRVPSLPLWAELLWDNNEKQKKAAGVPSNPKPEWR